MNRHAINISSLHFKWFSQTLKIAPRTVLSFLWEGRKETEQRAVMSNYFISVSHLLSVYGFVMSTSHWSPRSRTFLQMSSCNQWERPLLHMKLFTCYLIVSSKQTWWLIMMLILLTSKMGVSEAEFPPLSWAPMFQKTSGPHPWEACRLVKRWDTQESNYSTRDSLNVLICTRNSEYYSSQNEISLVVQLKK